MWLPDRQTQGRTDSSVRQIHRTGRTNMWSVRYASFPVGPNCPMLFQILCILCILRVRQIEVRSYEMILLTEPNVLWSSTKFRGHWDRQTKAGQSDPYMPFCFAGDSITKKWKLWNTMPHQKQSRRKLFSAWQRSQSRSSQWPWCHSKGHHSWRMHILLCIKTLSEG